jgi:hypothetical protein
VQRHDKEAIGDAKLPRRLIQSEMSLTEGHRLQKFLAHHPFAGIGRELEIDLAGAT